MQIVRIVNEKIWKISENEYQDLLKKHENKSFTCEDCRLYILTKDDGFIAIDNLSSEFFVEEFKTLTAAYIWLCGLSEYEPLHEAENTEGWY